MSLAIGYALKKRAERHGGATKKAEGGEHGKADEKDADMIARIMHKRKEYSEGGMVANDVEPIADEMPAQFDDLALDDALEDHSGAGNGEGEDAVSRIMKKRKK